MNSVQLHVPPCDLCPRPAALAVAGGTSGRPDSRYELPEHLCLGCYGLEWHRASAAGVRLEVVPLVPTVWRLEAIEAEEPQPAA